MSLSIPSRSTAQRLRYALGAALATAVLLAGPARAAGEPAVLEGQMLSGSAFSLAAQRGKVVMVVFWATDCPVCRDSLPELRANANGWRRKPFVLVTVATDARRQDVVDYERLLHRIVPEDQRVPSLWRGEPGLRDGFGPTPQLPAAFVLDRDGRVIERYAGRIPPAAWDRVAELVP